MRVLLLEDDIQFSEMIEKHLNLSNYSIDAVFDLDSAEELLYNNKYDLLILPANLPVGNGLDLLESFRNLGHKTPTIIISTVTDIDSIQRAYRIGCDDYIKKPFDLKELQSRITYIEHIHKIHFKDQIQIDSEIVFDAYNMNIRKNNIVNKIPRKEAEIIKFFLLNENRIITVDELIINVWEFNEQPSIATIRTYMKNIRKDLKKDFLETIKNVGYKYSTTY